MWYSKETQQVIPTLRLVKMVTGVEDLADDFTHSDELGIYPLVITNTLTAEAKPVVERVVYNNIVEDTELKQFTAEAVIETVPTDQVQPYYDKVAYRVRKERDNALAVTDWTQARDVVLPNDKDWKTYRQSLRDITDQEGFPFTINWPTKPQ